MALQTEETANPIRKSANATDLRKRRLQQFSKQLLMGLKILMEAERQRLGFSRERCMQQTHQRYVSSLEGTPAS